MGYKFTLAPSQNPPRQYVFFPAPGHFKLTTLPDNDNGGRDLTPVLPTTSKYTLIVTPNLPPPPFPLFHLFRGHGYHKGSGDYLRQQRLKWQGTQPHPSSVHLIESDQDIWWYEENIKLGIIGLRPGLLILPKLLVQGGILAGTVQGGGGRRLRLCACFGGGIGCINSEWKRRVICIWWWWRRRPLLFRRRYPRPASAPLPTLSLWSHEDGGRGDADLGPP